ncbi:hypothetical protein D3C72_2576740 [compost metagenome]
MPHGANGMFATKKYTVEVGPVHSVPVGQICMLRIMGHRAIFKTGNPCIVYQDV